MLTLFLAAALSDAGAAVLVVDDAAAPVAAAAVSFVDRTGGHDDETTDAAGRAASRTGFAPTQVTIGKAGFTTASVALSHGVLRVVLERSLSTIGRVRVATGSARSAHELPVATAVLDRAAIAGVPAASADRLLRELPGADYVRSNSAFTNYGQLRASFSGAGSDRGIVIADGVPAQDGFGGQIDWQAYPTDAIERVELLRGAGSALYGSGGIGGVLALTTLGPRVGAAQAAGSASLGLGTNQSQDAEVLLTAPLGAHLAASLAQVDSRFAYRDLAPGYTSPIDHAAQAGDGSTDLRARYGAGATTVDVAGLFASDHQDEGRPNYTFDRTLRQEALSATRTLGTIATVGAAYYARDTTVDNIADTYPAKPGVLRYVQHVPSHEDGFGTTLEATPGHFDVALRIDERRTEGSSVQDGTGGVLQALGTGVELTQGIALQATYRAGGFEALAGARADRLRYDDILLQTVTAGVTSTATVAGHDEGAISPRVGLRYDLTPRLAIRASAGGGFRGPYLNELVRGFNIGKIVEAPNPNLVPERSTSTSAGLDYLLGTSRLSLDAVETRVRDAIAFVTLSPTLMRRENLDRTQSDSETLQYARPLGGCARLRASGTLQTARITSGPPGTIGKQLAFVPAGSANVGVDGGNAIVGFSFDGSYAGQTYADTAQQQPLGAALLFGATVRASLRSGTSLELTGDNLTHQAYLSSVDRYGPPFALALHLRVPLGAVPSASVGCR